LNGKLLNLSYGTGRIQIVPHERVGDSLQGGICALPIPDLPTGIMRGRFNPKSGDLYVTGMSAWATDKLDQPGGFYRLHATGKPAYAPVGLRAHRTGIDIVFSDPIDASVAADLTSYKVTTWSLNRSEKYVVPEQRPGVEDCGRHGIAGSAAAPSAAAGNRARAANGDFLSAERCRRRRGHRHYPKHDPRARRTSEPLNFAITLDGCRAAHSLPVWSKIRNRSSTFAILIVEHDPGLSARNSGRGPSDGVRRVHGAFEAIDWNASNARA
jgi:hypothetical protein